jgi:hypothetical protein
MTSGDAEIQDVQPYYGYDNHNHDLSLLDDEGEALQLKELTSVDLARSSKTVSLQARK